MNQPQVKTLLIGTTEFASEIFSHLFTLTYLDIIGLVTQPDKYKGRKHILESPPTKKTLLGKEIHIFQPIKFREEYKKILEITSPDLIIVCAYGKILPKEFIEYPKYKCINIHASLLPELRGATPVQSAILKRLKQTGVTLQVMNEKMDEGDIISSAVIGLDEKITTSELFQKMIPVTIDLIENSLPDYLRGIIIPSKQIGNIRYCYVADFNYEKGEIDWGQSKYDVLAKIRAFNPEPGAWVKNLIVHKTIENLVNQRIKIYSAKISSEINAGNFVIGNGLVKDNKLLVLCTDGWIEITSLQKEGGKIVSAKDFINGLK